MASEDLIVLLPVDLIAEIESTCPEIHRQEVRLVLRLVMRYFADNIHFARLNNGSKIGDVTDVKMLFDQCVDILAVNARMTRSLQRTCPRCGHVHEGDRECGAFMGGGGFCRCEVEIPV
jgi:hypothetical protein